MGEEHVVGNSKIDNTKPVGVVSLILKE